MKKKQYILMIVLGIFALAGCATTKPEVSTKGARIEESSVAKIERERETHGSIYNTLQKLVLRPVDLPKIQSWRLHKQSAISNEATAIEWGVMIDKPDAWLRQFDSWGRIDGYKIEFVGERRGRVGHDVLLLSSVVEIFETANGASEAFHKICELNLNQSMKKLKDSGFKVLKLETRESPAIGHESLMIMVKVETPMPTIVLEILSIIWRRDRILASIDWGSDSSLFESEVIQLAKVQDYRIESVQKSLSREIKEENKEGYYDYIKEKIELKKARDRVQLQLVQLVPIRDELFKNRERLLAIFEDLDSIELRCFGTKNEQYIRITSLYLESIRDACTCANDLLLWSREIKEENKEEYYDYIKWRIENTKKTIDIRFKTIAAYYPRITDNEAVFLIRKAEGIIRSSYELLDRTVEIIKSLKKSNK